MNRIVEHSINWIVGGSIGEVYGYVRWAYPLLWLLVRIVGCRHLPI